MDVELKVTPDKYLPHRYAGASGDFNPIHIDAEFAKQVGLPVEHPARALLDGPGGARLHARPPAATRARCAACRSSSAAWACPSRRSSSPAPRRTTRGHRGSLEAAQGGNKIIRNAEAELATAPRIRTAWRSAPARRFILRKVVEAHVELDQPVGSKWIAEQDDVPWGPSTVRAELARLEEAGLLEHPHTSAGRVPTDRGYRFYVDELLAEGQLPVPRRTVELTAMRREVDEAMRATTEQLSQVTNLLALVTAPPIETATIHRVEVLLLQPQVAMVVVITSTGGVTKRVISYDEPVDPGLVDWAASYLNEALGGMDVGSRMLLQRSSTDPALGAGRARLPRHARARLHRARGDGREQPVHGGRRAAAVRAPLPGAVADRRPDGGARAPARAARRAARVADRAERLPAHRRGEPDARSCSRVSIVAANYGLARRNLGAVSVIGPVRMDYPGAIGAVREAARELSRFVAEVYDE